MSEPVLALPALVIVGCQRSGTTLLQRMLAKHPNILAHPEEPQFFLGAYHRFGNEIKNVGRAVNYFAGHRYFPQTVDPTQIMSAFAGMSPVTLQTFVENYIRIWGSEDLNYKHPLIKHPNLVYHLDLVSQIFPGALIVHIIRDPRSNVLSQRNRWPKISVTDGAFLWRGAVRRARSWAKANPDRYLEIKYEDLVREPADALTNILRRAGLDFDPTPLLIDFESIVYDRGRPAGTIVHQKLDRERIESWKSGMSAIDIGLIEMICTTEMEWFSYPLEGPQVPPLRFAARLLLERLRNWVIVAGRAVKAFIRHAGWRLGILSTSI